jgi:hypothetical protein
MQLLGNKRITVIDTASACGNRNLVLKKTAIGNNTANKKASNMGIITVFPYKIYT